MECITAVMITGKQPERLEFAKAAIRAFHDQIYSEKQLLIINDGSYCLQTAAPELFRDNVRELRINQQGLSLGALRNIGLDEVGTGNLLMQWDDDDFYHYRRINDQADLFVKQGAEHPVTLSSQVRYSFTNNTAIEVYQPKQPDGVFRGIPGTILYRVGTRRYELVGKHEDSWFFNGFETVHVLDNRDIPELYIRFEHGFNTWDIRHIMGRYADSRRRGTLYVRPPTREYLIKILNDYYSWAYIES